MAALTVVPKAGDARKLHPGVERQVCLMSAVLMVLCLMRDVCRSIPKWVFAVLIFGAVASQPAKADLADLIGVNSPKKVKISIVQAPQYPEILGLRSMEINPAQDVASSAFSARIASSLQRAQVQGHPFLDILPSGSTAKADAALSVKVMVSTVNEQRYQETRKECLRYKRPDNSSGFLSRLLTATQCADGAERSVQVNCQRRDGDFQSLVTITSRNNKVIYSNTVVGKANDAVCSDANRPLASADALLDKAQNQALSALEAAIVPKSTQTEVELMAADAVITDEGARKRFEGALRFAEGNRLDRACSLLRELDEAYGQSSIALNYNLGICGEAEGNPWGADERYQKADKLTMTPNEALTAALNRVRASMKQAVARGGTVARGGVPTSTPVSASPRKNEAAGQPVNVPIAQPIAAAGLISADNLLEDKRVALVIGNGDYRNVGKLPNAVNDAVDIAARLKKLKFDVILRTNTTWEDMDQAVTAFTQKLKSNGVSLFYYAGHGAQVKDQNYILPIDLDLKSVTASLDRDSKERLLQRQSISLTNLMSRLGAANSAFNIVILDACRDDPVEKKTRSLRKTRAVDDSVAGGLARMDAPKGSYIAYSTQPGNVALDGSDDVRNSPFAAGLLKALQVPNLKLEDVMKRVRSHVDAETDHQQLPWDNSSLVGDFFFFASSSVPAETQKPVAVSGKASEANAAPRRQSVETKDKVEARKESVGVGVESPRQLGAENVPPAQAALPVQPPAPTGPGPQAACADRPNLVSKSLCEFRKCQEADWKNDPFCAKYNDKPGP